MGVNVLLFLIFQIAVEPWRRRRLVKGFEDKVVEAIEKEKALIRSEIAQGTTPALASLASATPEQVDSVIESSISTLETYTAEEPAKPTVESSSTAAIVSETPPATTPESLYSRLSNISYSPLSLEYWQTASNEIFSERSVSTSQRDYTVAAIQSAAAGAAVMGLVIALVNPR